jgi:hypothetical protein
MNNNKIVWGKPPSENISLKDCEWYHIMEIPGIGLTEGVFDVREDIGNIFGNLDLKNKKVLNVGPSTGYLSFEAERRGADVTSVDLSVDSEERDWVPQVQDDWRKDLKNFMADEKRRRNAFWYAHKALNSKSKLIISHINNLPNEVEAHDIGIIFSVLVHIRDPFLALQRMTSHIKEKIVITELGGYTRRNTLKNFIPNLFRKIFSILNKNKISPSNMKFLPRYGRVASKWWNYSPDAIIEMIKLLGFGKSTVNYHYYLDKNGKKVFQFTVVGERTVPMDKCDYQYDAN